MNLESSPRYALQIKTNFMITLYGNALCGRTRLAYPWLCSLEFAVCKLSYIIGHKESVLYSIPIRYSESCDATILIYSMDGTFSLTSRDNCMICAIYVTFERKPAISKNTSISLGKQYLIKSFD